MKHTLVRVVPLVDSGDERGSSFSITDKRLSFVGVVCDMHLSTIHPGSIRGNHYHREHREIIIVLGSDVWSFHYDSGPKTRIRRRRFDGKGAVAIEVEPTASHAILNNGAANLFVIGLSDKPYNSKSPDNYSRAVVKM